MEVQVPGGRCSSRWRARPGVKAHLGVEKLEVGENAGGELNILGLKRVIWQLRLLLEVQIQL